MRVLGVVLLLAACSPASERVGEIPAPDGWEQLAPVPTPRTEVGAALDDDRIYIAGGFDAEGATVPTVEAYTIEDDTWEETAPLPLAVNHPMAAASDGTVYLLGGFTSEGPPTGPRVEDQRRGGVPVGADPRNHVDATIHHRRAPRGPGLRHGG